MAKSATPIKKLINNALSFNTKLWLTVALGLMVIFSATVSIWYYRKEARRRYQERLTWQVFYAKDAAKSEAALEVLTTKTQLFMPQRALLDLKKAGLLVNKKDFSSAFHEYIKVLKQPNVVAEFKSLALVRSVRILSELKRYEEGFKLLENYKRYLPSLVLEELKGDLYLASRQPAKARKCYLKARASNYLTLDSRQRLTLKLLDT